MWTDEGCKATTRIRSHRGLASKVEGVLGKKTEKRRDYGSQEMDLRLVAGSAIRGRDKLVRWCPVPRTKSEKSTSIGGSTVCGDSPWKSYS